MKRLNRRITASTDRWGDEFSLPIKTLVEMLHDIPELAEVEIDSTQIAEDTIIIRVGDSEYKFMSFL